MLLGLGTYTDSEGIVRNDDGSMVTGDSTTIDMTSTGTALACDPDAAYPVGSVCWGIQQGIDAKAILQTMTGPAAASNPTTIKPCMGVPVFKGVSNCLLAGAAAVIALMALKD